MWIGGSMLCGQKISTTYPIMFYNAENLFDLQNDSIHDDDEFLPTSIRRWTPKRYRNKLVNLARVIATLGKENIPAIVGLCEIENDSVLHDLTSHSPLKVLGYRFITAQTSDARGIRTALLYQPSIFKPLITKSHPIESTQNRTLLNTRQILHVIGLSQSRDTLDLFICHFPSRSGGVASTEPNRIQASQRLKQLTDSIATVRNRAYTIVMGDFNDNPSDESIDLLSRDPSPLHKIDHTYSSPFVKGSYKYQEEWFQFDQILVSSALLNKDNSLHLSSHTCYVFSPEYLIENDPTGYGKRPFRTYYGMKYHGGYSDHLPIYILLNCTIKETEVR